MKLLNLVRKAIAAWIAPPEKSTALAVQQAPVNGHWEQVKVGDIVRSYLYICRCQQQQELTPSEAKSPALRKCGCGKPYNLLRDLALTPDSAIGDYEYALMTLPVRALAVQQQPRQRHVTVGDEPVRDPWSGRRDAAVAFEQNDPARMGPGF